MCLFIIVRQLVWEYKQSWVRIIIDFLSHVVVEQIGIYFECA